MIPIISFTDSLMHPIGVQQVVSDILAYFKDSTVLKDQLTTMDLPPVTILLMADTTIMYSKIDNSPALNQLSQYFNVHKTKYLHLPVDTVLRSLCLMMKNNIFYFGDSHWLQLKHIVMGTPPAPTYPTVFYSVFE